MAAQRLSGESDAGLVEAVEETGFVRTLGGVDVYLALRARVPGMQRRQLDEAAARRRVAIIPAVRGCIYLVPRRYLSLCLRFADLRTRSRAEREHQKAGILPGELDALGQAVLDAIGDQGPLTTTALRSALPEVRSLGEAGKKVGLSSPLPPALRQLEFSGLLERAPERGRLDTERYLWRRPDANPFEEHPVPDDPKELNARLAEIFFRAAGLGTMAAFAGWAGISQRDARAALEQIEVRPVQIEGHDGVYLASPRCDPWLERPPENTAAALLPFEDNLIALQGSFELLVDPAHWSIESPAWGGRGKSQPLAEARHATLRSLVAGGKISGFWEYDPDQQTAVWSSFAPLPQQLRSRVEELAAETGRFLSEELGHGRSFSLDTDEDLRRRAGLILEPSWK